MQDLAKGLPYLQEHTRAQVAVALRDVTSKIKRLVIGDWLGVETEERRLNLVVDEDALAETSRLDGCYVIKTDLPANAVDKQIIHDRYKDLAAVERAFRAGKTAHLEVRPIYVRTEDHTRGHVLVVMLGKPLAKLRYRAIC